MKSGLRRAGRVALQALLVFSLAWSALFLGWQSLRPLDFGYPLLYRWLDISAHIQRYGPLNQYKAGLESTTDAERQRIFGAINRAVHRGGVGLELIRYGEGRGFLRPPEVQHLRSVARLIGALEVVSWAMLALLAGSAGLLWRTGAGLPRPARVLQGAGAVLAVGVVAVLLLGPERVFNTLHVWIFPAGEQWFFYYEESLMTTLMKAPDLFGAIAVLLLIVSAAWFAILLLGLRRLLATPAPG